MNKNSALLALLCLTFLVFFPALDNQFVNWDDNILLLENARVQSLSFHNISQIFQNVELRTYIPLSILSFALEYHFVQYHPFLYHLNNVLLHLAVVALIFCLARKMGASVRAAFWGGLLFGVHPVHVESVAWVTERKDVLYSLFYVLTLYFYWNYLESRQRKPYLLTIVFTLLSILAKPMAYSLPLVLLLCDWFRGRTFDRRTWIEKTPHFFIIGLISLVTYTSNSTAIYYRPGEILLIWIWNFCFYIQKFLVPFDLNPVYNMPQSVTIAEPSYAAAVLTFVILLLMVIRFCRHRWFILAVLFYSVSISFLVIRSVWDFGNRTIVADRFMYLPSLGFCLLFGVLVDQWLEKLRKKNILFGRLAGGVVVGVFLGLMAKTVVQTNVWQDGVALWSEVITDNPRMVLAYVNRAERYQSQGKFDLAMADYATAARIDPQDPDLYFYRAMAYSQRNDFPAAIADYKKVIELKPDKSLAYFNLGHLYDTQGETEAALANYTRAIETDPKYTRAYNNRGYLYLTRKQYEPAHRDFRQALELEPYHTEALNNMGVLHFEQGQYEEAFRYFNQAITASPRSVDAYSNRAVLYALAGKYDEARQDINQMLALDPARSSGYLIRGNLSRDRKQYDEAVRDYTQAIALDPNSYGAYRERAMIYIKQGDFEKAAADARKLQAAGQDITGLDIPL